MKSNIAYKFRLYPDEHQKVMFTKTFGCCRKVYNLMLADKIEYYKREKKSLQTTPAQYKKDHPYLKEVDSLALANEQLHLQTAYKNFFQNKKTGFPKFKSKHNDKNSYTTNNQNGTITVGDNFVRLPKVGKVPAKIHRQIPDDYIVKSATISQERSGNYYISVLCKYDEDAVSREVVTHIGLDYKSDGLYADSNGDIADVPKWYRLSETKLGKLQRRMSKKQKGSKNRNRARIKAAKLSEHIANQRRDYLHKRSAEITNQYDLISVETLNMQNMSKGLHLGKSTLDNGYGMFISMLTYKQQNKGHYLIKVDKWYPSSQLCSCGYKNPITKDLSIKTVICPACGSAYNRDINAARNIDKEGYRLYQLAHNTAGTAGINACGHCVRPEADESQSRAVVDEARSSEALAS